MRKVLITGASGFVGRHCLEALSATEAEVHAVVRPGTTLENHAGPVHHLDLLDPLKTRQLLAKLRPSHLLHLAWIATPGIYLTSPENHHWLECSLQLMEAFVENGGRRVVVAGTCAEYDWSAGRCHETTTPLAPSSVYGQCKNVLRLKMESLANRYGVSAAWARLFWLYGPHEDPRRLVAATILKLLRGECGQGPFGTHERDFLHISDAGHALAALLDSDVNGAVNIGSGEAVSICSLIDRIVQQASGHSSGDSVERRTFPQEPPLVVADITRLRDEVGFRPRFTLNQGVEQTISWWRSHGQNVQRV